MGRLRSFVIGQLRLLPATARLLTGRRAVPADGFAVTYGRSDRLMLGFIVPVTILEALVVGALFHRFAVMRYIDIAQWWGAFVVLGLFATAVVYPHVVTPTEIRLRHRDAVHVLPLHAVRGVRWNPQRTRPEGESLYLATRDGTQLTFDLGEPLAFGGKAVSTVHAAADDKADVGRIRALLDEASA